MTSPNLTLAASQTRTEDETRELAKAYHRAETAYTGMLYMNSAGLTEDERVDNLIAVESARTKMTDAYLAFRASIKAAV